MSCSNTNLKQGACESMFNNYDDVMSVKDVMSALGICKHSVYQLIESGQLSSFKIGRAHKIPKCSLITYIKHSLQDENLQ